MSKFAAFISLSSVRCVISRAACVFGLAAAVLAHADPSLSVAVSRSPLSLPLYIAHEKGYFAAEGLDVRLVPCVGGPNCLRALQGRAEVATSSEMSVVFSSFERDDYAIIATMATTNDSLKLVGRAGAVPSSPADWAGKRVGTVIGSAGHYYLDLYLLNLNLDPRRLHIVGMEAEQLVDALRDGRVDVITVWEPFGYLAAKAPGANGVVLPRLTSYVQTFNLVVPRRLIPARDEDLVRLLRAVDRGVQFIQDRPTEAQAVLRRTLDLDAGFVTWVWSSSRYRLAIDESLVRTMESEARWALREGQIKGTAPPNMLRLFHTTPLSAVKPSAISLNR